MYLAAPAKEDPGPSPLSGLSGYDSVKEAGLIDES
jgi:hypothetical protein